MEKRFKIRRVPPFSVNNFQEEEVYVEISKFLTAHQDFNWKTIGLLFLIIDLIMESKMSGKYDNLIYLSPSIVKERIGFSEKTFYRSLKPLLESKVLTRIKPNLYKINPKMIR